MREKVNRRFDIPFAGGASKSGKTIYVDRRIPSGFSFKGKFYKARKFIVLHEQIEQAHFRRGASYSKAHAQANKVEKAAVKRARIPLGGYQAWTRKIVKSSGHERTRRTPRLLDRRPYKQTKSLRLLGKRR